MQFFKPWKIIGFLYFVSWPSLPLFSKWAPPRRGKNDPYPTKFLNLTFQFFIPKVKVFISSLPFKKCSVKKCIKLILFIDVFDHLKAHFSFWVSSLFYFQTFSVFCFRIYFVFCFQTSSVICFWRSRPVSCQYCHRLVPLQWPSQPPLTSSICPICLLLPSIREGSSTVPEKIFRLVSMKNRLLQGLMGESGQILELEWR